MLSVGRSVGMRTLRKGGCVLSSQRQRVRGAKYGRISLISVVPFCLAINDVANNKHKNSSTINNSPAAGAKLWGSVQTGFDLAAHIFHWCDGDAPACALTKTRRTVVGDRWRSVFFLFAFLSDHSVLINDPLDHSLWKCSNLDIYARRMRANENKPNRIEWKIAEKYYPYM